MAPVDVRALRPWVTTAFFPRLPPGSRAPFRAVLILVVAAAAGFALLGWRSPVIVISVLALPAAFVVYLHRTADGRSIRGRYLALVAVVAVGLGVGWELLTNPMVEDAYYAEMGGQLTLGQLLVCGVALPVTFAVALVAPAVVVRALDRSSRDALAGFTIGAWGATMVNAAATATYLAPELTVGLTAGRQPVESLLAEAMVEGVAWPLGSAAAGGLFGLALWFTPKANAPRRYRRTILLPAAFLGAVAFAVTMGFVDVAPISMNLYLALQLPIALAAVLAVRAAVADALPNEATDDSGGQTRGPDDDDAAAHQPAPPTYRNVVTPVAAGIGVAVAIAILVPALLTPPPPAYVCPPDCGRPPWGKPVETNPRYSGDDGAFSVSYPSEGAPYEVTFDPPGMNGVQARYIAGDTGLVNLFGESAEGRSAEQVVADVLESTFPEAIVSYEIPNASVGYEPGYGVVADQYSRGTRLRVVVMAAVRHDYALIATAAGPFHEFTQDYGTGHPSGVNLEVAMDLGKYVNSFRWFADRRSPQR